MLFNCFPVLNDAALARAYRVVPVRLNPMNRVLAQNRMCNITSTAELIYLYHKPERWGIACHGFLKVAIMIEVPKS